VEFEGSRVSSQSSIRVAGAGELVRFEGSRGSWKRRGASWHERKWLMPMLLLFFNLLLLCGFILDARPFFFSTTVFALTDLHNKCFSLRFSLDGD
jgi:hypothetical protein